MIYAATAAAITLVAGLWVLYPLLGRKAYSSSTYRQSEYDELREKRETAYGAISELESDLELGKLSQADYDVLYERYRRQAVAALKATSEREALLSTRIEQAVRDARRASGTVTGPATDERPQAAAVECSTCGSEVKPGAAYCSACGTALAQRPVMAAAPKSKPSRRPLAWFTALGVIFLLFAAGTAAVYVRGSQQASSARAIGSMGGEPTALLVSPTESTILIAWTVGGLRRSTDGGETWTSTKAPEGAVAGLAGGTEGGMYALIEGTPYRSADGGQTWSQAGKTPTPLVTLAATPGGTLYAADGSGKVWASSDEGATWNVQDREPVPGLTSLAVASGDPLILFGAVQGSGVVIGQEDGWGSASGVINGRLPTSAARGVAFDPSSGEGAALPGGGEAQGTLFVATDLGVFRSVDYGSDWVGTSLRQDIQAVAAGPPGTALVYAVARDGSVYRSVDRGRTWDGS